MCHTKTDLFLITVFGGYYDNIEANNDDLYDFSIAFVFIEKNFNTS